MLKFEKLSKGSMVIDMDDVLVFTTNYWFKCIVDRYEIFKPYIKENIIPEDYDYDGKDFMYPMDRPTYYFADWLLKEDLSIEDNLIGRRFIMEAYLEQNEFYQRALSTPIVSPLIQALKSHWFTFDKLYVVTRTFDEKEKDKIKCIKYLFHQIIDQVEIIFVNANEKKSDAIKDIEKVSLIIDDELSNVYDYLDNCDNIKNSTIMIPKAGYNSIIDKKYIKKAEDNNIILRHYDYK